MGTIMARQKKDGAKSFTAVIRKKKGGKIVLTLSDTFSSRQAAERWMKKTERDLKDKGALDRLCCTNRVMAEVPLSPDGLIPRLP
ncbi:hypothetical protein [Salipiger bermudensis]|uniref:hypothetical protein n=1 Tax=Salipiger bermudensis TaxID=344736 RepID=UPI001CD58C94|nr:hypothetical protein [Salipiger bermudensis]MCA1287912.1 hypothetical protein [Salipiger bermudensis]